MTYRNFMVYGTVDMAALPPDAMPIEVFIDNKEAIDDRASDHSHIGLAADTFGDADEFFESVGLS